MTIKINEDSTLAKTDGSVITAAIRNGNRRTMSTWPVGFADTCRRWPTTTRPWATGGPAAS